MGKNIFVFARLRGFIHGAVVLATLATAGCLSEPSGPHASEQQALNDAKKLWRAQNLSDYSYVFSRGCFCVLEYREPTTVTVRGGAVISAVAVSNGASRDTSSYSTVEGLFEVIQKAIDDNAATIQAKYDPTRGYLTSAYIDFDQRMADEEFSVEAKSLTPAR
jgi:hypothetical protein